MHYIQPFYVCIGLFIGFFFIYILDRKPKIILKIPTLDNYKDTMYVDDVGVCYKYRKIKVDCNENK